MEKFSEIGIEVQTGTVVEAIERVGSGFRVRARAKSREIAIVGNLAARELSATELTSQMIAAHRRIKAA
jgi:hypothetical protein